MKNGKTANPPLRLDGVFGLSRLVDLYRLDSNYCAETLALKSVKNLQENLRYCLGVQRVPWGPGVSLFTPLVLKDHKF